GLLDEVNRTGRLTHDLWVYLFAGVRGTHSIGLSGTRLAIRQERHIITLDERVDAFTKVLPYALLINIRAKYPIEHENLATVRAVNSKAGWARHLDHRALEPLRYKFKSGVRRF